MMKQLRGLVTVISTATSSTTAGPVKDNHKNRYMECLGSTKTKQAIKMDVQGDKLGPFASHSLVFYGRCNESYICQIGSIWSGSILFFANMFLLKLC